MLYALAVLGTVVFLIYKVAPVYGKKHALVYLSVCSLVGSISIMGIKALGMALKLTFSGNNQFTHPSTYAFLLLSAGCIVVQMNYFNKALASFPANMYVPPIALFSAKTLTREKTTLLQSQPSVLCDVYDGHAIGFPYPLRWFEHQKCRYKPVATAWLAGHFCRRHYT